MREVPPQTPEIFPEGVSQGRIKSWAIKQLNKKWTKEEVQFDEEDMWSVWEAFWKNSTYQIEPILFTKEETEKLLQICRHHEVTINSLLQIAFVKAREETIGPYDKKVKMGTAVDSRERLRAEIHDAVGLYAGGIIFHFDYKRDADFWDNVRNYHQVVHKNLKDNKIFGPIIDQISINLTLYDALLFAVLGNQVEPHQPRYSKLSEFASRKTGMVTRYLKKFDRNIPNVMSTNLGRLSIPGEVNGIEIERVFFTPSSGLKLEIVTGVATANGRLTVTLNYHSRYFDGTQLRKVRERAEEILKGLFEA